MKIDLMNIDKFIEVNNVQEVTNPIYFNKGSDPTDDGLFSYSIFGRTGSPERKSTYGYISLRDYFLHPLVYKNLIFLNRKFEECINGFSYFTISADGDLIPSNEDEGKTGIKFLYKNWDKLSFKSSDSNKRDERIDFFKSIKKSEAFINKYLVCPAYKALVKIS